MIAGTLEIQLMANMARLQKDMDDAKRAVGGAMSAIESSVNLAKGALAGLAAGLSIAGLTQMLRASIDVADGLNDLSKSTGLTVQQLSGLKLAAQQSGGELEGTAAAINKLSVAMAKDAERFARLGVTAKEPLEAFKQLADVFSAIEDPQLRAAFGAEALGKSWASAAPLLAEGSKGIDAMVTKGMAMSGVTQEMADRADEFNDRMAELGAATDGAKMKLAGGLLPAMTATTIALTEALDALGKSAVVMGTLSTAGEAVRLVWSDVAFVFEQTRNEIGGIGAQIAAVLRGDFAGAATIRDAMVADAKAARAALDAYQRGVVNPKSTAIPAIEGTSGEDARLARLNAQLNTEAAESSRKAADFLKSQNDAQAKRDAAIKAANDELKKQAAVMAEINGVLPSFNEDWARLNTMYAKGKISLEQLTDAQGNLLAKQPGVIKNVRESEEAHRTEEKALREVAEARQKVIDGLTDSADSIGDQVQKLQDESTALGIAKAQNLSLAQAIELVAIARLEEKQAWAQSGNDMEAVAIIQREIDLRRQLIQEIGGKEARDAAAKGAQSAVDEWAKAGEKISDTITDALMRGFESGKGLIANLRDTFANVMQTSLVRPGVQGMVNMGSNFLGLGGGSSSTGMLSGLMNLGSTFGSSMASGFQLAMNGGTGMAMEGGWAMLTSATGGSSALAGLGQLAGAAAPWVAGAMLLSEAISGLNGGKEYTTGGGITGKFDSTGFAGRNYQTWQNDGDKVFGISVGHSSSGTNYSAMDTAQVKAFTQSFEAIKASAAGYASAIGANATSIDAYSKEIKVAMGSDAEANAAAIAAIFTTIANEVAATVVEAKYIRDGETASATLQRLSTSLTVVNASFDLVGKSLLTVSQVGANTASQLVDRFGGADAYASAMTQFNQDFYTEEERLAKTRATLTKSFADMGMALPTTIEQYRNLVLAQDVSTEAGQKTYTTLIGLSTAFKTITDTVDPLSDAFVDIASTVKALISDIQSQRDQVASARATVSGPTGVMSAGAISAAIGAAMVNAPSNAAVLAANAGLSAANGNLSAAQTTVANRTTQLGASESAASAARAAITSTVETYKAKVAQLYEISSHYGMYTNAKYTGNTQEYNDAYAYNATTNRFAGYEGRTFDPWYGDRAGWAALNVNGSAYDSQKAAVATLKKELDGANAVVLQTEVNLAKALAKVTTDSSALAAANAAAATAQTAQQLALAKAKAAQADYAAALASFNVDAAKSSATLGKLREETVKYYEAQKAIADQMVASSTNLKAAVANLRSEQLDPATVLQQKLAAFDSAYSMALSTTGSTQAGYADKLTALLPDLSTALQGSVGSREEWIAATAALAAKSDSIAKLLDTGVAGMDYQAESLALLDQIDTTLAALGDSTQLITDAIKSSGGLTVAGLREVVTALGGTPAFASGGYHSGGLRMVGENGPELEVTGPSYIFNAQQTAAMRRGGGSGGDTSRLEALLEMVVEELANSRAEGRATASHTSKVARILERVSRNGDSLQTVPAT